MERILAMNGGQQIAKGGITMHSKRDKGKRMTQETGKICETGTENNAHNHGVKF